MHDQESGGNAVPPDQEMGGEGENVPPTQEKIEIKEVFHEPSIVAPLLIGTAIGAATFFMVSK
jgi:hypothetical protein